MLSPGVHTNFEEHVHALVTQGSTGESAHLADARSLALFDWPESWETGVSPISQD
jgi:hypothetical protein